MLVTFHSSLSISTESWLLRLVSSPQTVMLRSSVFLPAILQHFCVFSALHTFLLVWQCSLWLLVCRREQCDESKCHFPFQPETCLEPVGEKMSLDTLCMHSWSAICRPPGSWHPRHWCETLPGKFGLAGNSFFGLTGTESGTQAQCRLRARALCNTPYEGAPLKWCCLPVIH